MKQITEYCTGCRACEQLCGKKAIRLIADKEGFLTATIDENCCVDCGLCRKHCSTKRSDLVDVGPLSTLAVRMEDEQTQHRSS